MDFDDAKENIQPLAAGRDASILQAVLNIDYQNDLSKQREALENAIGKYDGTDPLQAWFEYVSWIEQSYPSGGYEGGLKKVLIKCLEHFESDERYLQDRRLIRIYIKFIDSEDNPPELYQELFNAGIGTMVSDLYICWAYYYDLCGNFKKADTIFRKGIELRAQPFNELIQAHKNFGFTMSQRMLYQDEQSKYEFLESLKKRRQALTSLSISTVGSIRHVSETNSRNPGKIQTLSDKTVSYSENNTVMEDDRNIALGADIETSKSIVRNIIECKRNQENKREAGPWSKRFTKHKGNLFKESHHTNDLGFTILEDDLPDDKHTNFSFDSTIDREQVLSITGIKLPLNFPSKNDPQDTWKVETVLDGETKPKTIPAYRKNYHYSKPNHDFSLEEYLAYNWFKKINVKNCFIEDYRIFWGDEISVGIRLYPNFVSKSSHNDNNCNFNYEKLLLPEKMKLAINYNNLYPNDNTEMQFEELLHVKWQNRKMKSHIDCTTTTQKNADKIVDTNAIKNVDSDCLTNSMIYNEHKSKENFNPKISTTKSHKLNSEIVDVDDKFHISNLCSQNINKNVSYPNLCNQENENILTDCDLLTSNESFSTQHFNLFIKKASVSTPLNNRYQCPVNNYNDQNKEQNDIIFSTKLLSKDLPESQLTFPIRQLSTIMETSESNTALRKSSVDTHNGIIIKNLNEQSLSDKSNKVPPKSIKSEASHIEQKLCMESKYEKKPIDNLVRNLFFEKENDKNDEFKKPDALNNLFEEKTDNFVQTLINQQNSVIGHNTEMFDFLAKTPEKKRSAILKVKNNRCDNRTSPNYTSELSNFEDLTLPPLTASPNSFKFSKTSDRSLHSFLKNTPIKEYSEDTLLNQKNNDGQKCSSNNMLIKNINEQDLPHKIHTTSINSEVKNIGNGTQSFMESKYDKKSLTNLVKNLSLENETDITQNLAKDESYNMKKNLFKKHNALTNLSVVNPINFFEEKTENLCEVLVNQKSNVTSYSAEIFDFLAKTPEKKITERLKPSSYQSGNSATKNIINEFSNFEDLCLPSLNVTTNICKSPKMCESSLQPEKDIAISFLKNTPGKVYSKPEESEKSCNEFDFLAKTPEKKITESLKSSSYKSDDSATKNIINEFSNFEDLCLPSLNVTTNTCKSPKMCSLQPDKNISISFFKNTPVKAYSKPDESAKNCNEFDFLTKTPEKKITERLKPISYQSGDSAKKNIINEFSNFVDLCLPSLNVTTNTCKSPKMCETSLQPDKNISFSFLKNTPGKAYSKPEESADCNELIHKKYEENSVVKKNNNILTNKRPKGNFHPDIYSIINSFKSKIYIIKTTCLKDIKKQNYEPYNFITYKNIFNININTVKEIIQMLNTELDELSLFKFINFENKISSTTRLKKKSLITENRKSPHEHLFNQNLSYTNKDISYKERTSIFDSKKYLESSSNDHIFQNFILKKLACIKDEKHNNAEELFSNFQLISGSLTVLNVPTKYEHDQILQRFTEIQFTRNSFKNDSSQYFFVNTQKTPQLEKYVKQNNEHINNNKQYISEQVVSTDVNPFSLDLIDSFLQKIDFLSYIEKLETCEIIEKCLRIKKGNKITINNCEMEVTNIIGQGAYGIVYCGKDLQTRKRFALKQERPRNLWEYYICLELRHRIQNTDILCGFMDIKYAIIAYNASIFLSEFSPYGSLIAVCNKIKCVTTRNIHEYVVMMLISQILVIIDHLHAAEIIHADIKPDNFLVINKLVYGSTIPSIQLIDFGVSIDLKQFPMGQKFTFAHTTQEFQCVEMRENRPWTFQIDLYGVASIIHVLLYGKYMEIEKLPRKSWIPKQNMQMPRHLNKTIWNKIFDELLNIRDCDSMPNLQDLRALLEQEIVEKEKFVKDKIVEFNNAIATL